MAPDRMEMMDVAVKSNRAARNLRRRAAYASQEASITPRI